MSEKIISEKVNLISVIPLDFTASDGNHICGYTIHYYRDKKDGENAIGKVYEKIYLPQDNLNDSERYQKKVYPCSATIEYEFVSLTKKPRPIRVII